MIKQIYNLSCRWEKVKMLVNFPALNIICMQSTDDIFKGREKKNHKEKVKNKICSKIRVFGVWSLWLHSSAWFDNDTETHVMCHQHPLHWHFSDSLFDRPKYYTHNLYILYISEIKFPLYLITLAGFSLALMLSNTADTSSAWVFCALYELKPTWLIHSHRRSEK